MLIILGSAIAYYSFSCFLKYYALIPSTVVPRKQGIWYNTFVSFVNSVLLSVAALYCFYVDPNRLFELTSKETNDVALAIPLFCMGYFAYDSIHCAQYLPLDKAKPICLHHALLAVCYLVGIYLDYYNYITVSLLYEINTVFLHLRTLCHLAEVPQSAHLYKCNKLVNLITFVIFRICNFTWIIFFTLFLMETIAVIPYAVGVLAMVALLLCNFYLLANLVKNDFGNRRKRSENGHVTVQNGFSAMNGHKTANGNHRLSLDFLNGNARVHLNGEVTHRNGYPTR